MRKFIALSLLCLAFLGCERDTTYDVLAQCITDSGTHFYGAFWCPHCKDQKEEFGDSVDLLPYVECDPNGKNSQANVCKAKGVESYPTWEFPDGTVKTGVFTIEELSEATSCPLPGEESIMMQGS